MRCPPNSRPRGARPTASRSLGAPLACLLLLGTLLGCKPRVDGPSAPASAAPTASAPTGPTGALSDSKEALMREVFDGWGTDRAFSALAPTGGADGEEQMMVVNPRLVVKIAADTRLLVVAGSPTDENGQAQRGHAEAGRLLLYTFMPREGRWFAREDGPAVISTGFHGEAGDVQVSKLGTDHLMVSVENGSCWQGYCGRWLELHELAEDGPHPLLESTLMLSSTSVGATAGCGDWLATAPGTGAATGTAPAAAAPASAPADVGTENCYDVDSRWHLEPPGDAERPNLVVEFSGREVVADDKTGKLSPRRVDDVVVLQHDGTLYRRVKGRFPTHSF